MRVEATCEATSSMRDSQEIKAKRKGKNSTISIISKDNLRVKTIKLPLHALKFDLNHYAFFLHGNITLRNHSLYLTLVTCENI